MPPLHRIRLRAAWEGRFPAEGVAARRIDLPTDWQPPPSGAFTLSRRFQTPRIDPTSERAWLVLDRVHGLTSAALDGEEVTAVEVGLSWVEIPLDVARRGARIVTLTVDPAAWPGGWGARDWGHVALEIRPADD